MRTSHKAAALATVFLAAGLVAAPAQATTEHCDAEMYPNKMEVDAGPSVYTGLEPGTEVCIKVGTRTDIVYVDSEGNITNTTLLNRNDKAMGISYYAYGDGGYAS